jgi:TolB-like protein
LKLIAEIRRRKLFRAVMIYVAAAWFLLGVFDLAFESWNIPEHTLRYVWIAVLSGFPVAVVLVWRYDITDDGIVRTSPSSSAERIDLSLHFSDYIILSVFVAVLCGIGYQLTKNIMGVEVDRRGDPGVREVPARSIAVLPFEDISPDGDQAYLGNGIADELRLELQRLDGLRVAGRTSSAAATQEGSKTIGEILNVGSILEGSIRKEGDSVRITVQLTQVADGFTIWSESYNRGLENIFEMQEEIAKSVAGALGVKLGVGTINAFRGAGTRNLEAYQAYLQGQNRNLTKQDRIRLLERAIELDPDYAEAWSELGLRTLSTVWESETDQVSEILDRAYPLVLRGVQLNPESAVAQYRLAMVRSAKLDWIGGEQGLARAIELLADRPLVAGYANVLLRNGRTVSAQKQYAAAVALEPLGGRPIGMSWHASLAQGRFAEAREVSNWQVAANRIENNLDIALNERDPEAISAAIQAMPESNAAYIGLFASVLAELGSPERILSLLRDVYLDENLRWPRKLHDIAMVAAHFDDPQFALKVKGQEVRVNTARMAALWYPVMSDVRRLPEFKTLVAELNLVEYWRTYGWADACRPLGDDDFECS